MLIASCVGQSLEPGGRLGKGTSLITQLRRSAHSVNFAKDEESGTPAIMIKISGILGGSLGWHQHIESEEVSFYVPDY
jgi:hypothetical protein